MDKNKLWQENYNWNEKFNNFFCSKLNYTIGGTTICNIFRVSNLKFNFTETNLNYYKQGKFSNVYHLLNIDNISIINSDLFFDLLDVDIKYRRLITWKFDYIFSGVNFYIEESELDPTSDEYKYLKSHLKTSGDIFKTYINEFVEFSILEYEKFIKEINE